MYLELSLHVRLASLTSSLISKCFFFFFLAFFRHSLGGCTLEGLWSPVCSSSLQQLLTVEVVGIFLFFFFFFQKRKPGFQFSEAHLSLFTVYWLIKCTKMLRFSHLHEPRQYVMPRSFVRLRCFWLVSMAAFLGECGELILLVK